MQARVRFFCLRSEIPFSGKFGSKRQNYQFKLKFGNQINLNMHNSVVRFTFSVFNRKYPSWENLVPKFKIICLNRNLMPRLIRLGSIQWWCSLFLSQGRKYLFWANFLQKIKIASLSLNFVPRLIQICRIQWWCSFSVITKLHFLGKFGPKN